ncbi:hypothetical protein, variant 1 [Blastomyces dermatitidis ER-3]|uniref:Vegetative cell wall protein gp1 n=1 Tax=Ajellomyces dermatitidis (strain ER-3 / ATCC MYA-2586) TaxID=559297 RepID=A0ABX2W1A8_AJEDR|nr:uncharacterized protein BDCG_09298 [Blastomyces dermatitidis ER-3]XP_045282893.1 hypothetical protein, variant 1 [Blastomyces dermatitidis ER-3]OAT03165.1 hypothetical protein BDCG_09298 [Blastomyces dermatitidis ER-3]OAT03166.1 hypothetical protein, variant 1 [Blastomyces dermatitidis ER-3]
MMTGLKRKLDQTHELGSASAVDSSQGEYYCQERNSEYLLLTAGHPVSSTSSSSRARGGNRGGSRSRARGKARAHIGRSKSLNGSSHDEPLPVQSPSDPQTPRAKRVRKAKEEIAHENGIAEANTPRPTRQSARILSKFHHMDSVPEEPDGSAIQQPNFNGPHEIHVGSDDGEVNGNDTASKSPSIRTRKSISDSQLFSFKSTLTDSSRRRRSSGYKTEVETSSPEAVSKPKSKSVDGGAGKRKNTATIPETPTIGSATKRASPVTTRKRNSTSKTTGPAETLNARTKNFKIEMSTSSGNGMQSPSERNGDDKNGDGDTDLPAPETRRTRPVPLLKIRNADSPAQSIELESPLAAREGTPTEVSGSRAATPSETAELSASTLPSVSGRGRGRGGFRGRARGRGWTRGRGRGGRGRGAGRGGRGGRLQPIDREISVSPSPVIKQLRERQKELDRVFRRVASAQRTALTVIANRTEAKLIKDANAHTTVPEYNQVMKALKARLQKRLDVIENEYNWRAKAADALLEANKERVNSNFHDKSRHIREEHLLAAQGSYMAFVEQCRQAEDDDHTETDESGSEADIAPRRRSVRGFNSSFVRDPKGAALYERAAYGWEDFIQRAKIENDISPQIKEITQEARPPVLVSDRISQLTEALTELCQREEDRTSEGKPSNAMPVEPPTALSTLADVAMGDIGQRPAQQPAYGPPLPGPQLAPFRNLPGVTQELPPQPYHPPLQHQPPRLSTDQHSRGLHRTILPQPVLGQMIPPTDPRSFLPPPTQHQPAPPPPPPDSQRGLPNLPRRILPASSRYPSIPHLNELPDPFSSTHPHLPPPPGMAYHPGPYPPHGPPPHVAHGPPPPPPQYMHAPIGHVALGPPYHHAIYGHPPPPPPPLHPGSQHPATHHQHQHQQQLQPHHQPLPLPRPQNAHPYQQQQQQYPQHQPHQPHQPHQHPLPQPQPQPQPQLQLQPQPPQSQSHERTPPPPYHE